MFTKLNQMLLLIFFIYSTTAHSLSDTNDEITKPEIQITLDHKVAMRDSVELSVNIYRPKETKEKLPVILYLTPYINQSINKRAWYLAEQNYVFIAVDLRGRGNSEGEFTPFENDGKDGYDLVEWAAKQSWSNGKVGMLGGSYVGFTQWATIKEFPPHLETILPIASVGPGIDFPYYNNIGTPYALSWLTFVSGKTALTDIFSNTQFWSQNENMYFKQHTAFRDYSKNAGIQSKTFDKWLNHPTFDEYWQSFHPTEKDYKKISIPILTLTGFYDADFHGAMNYYQNHMEHGKKSATDNHYLIIGPWHHGATRRPRAEYGGVDFGEASVIDMNQLYRDWFDWTLKDGNKPEILTDRVVYYTWGENQWKSAKSYSKVSEKKLKFYFNSSTSAKNTVFSSGELSLEKPTEITESVSFVADPLEDLEPSEFLFGGSLTKQFQAIRINGNGLVFHTEPFTEDIDIAGQLKLNLWLSMDVKDIDLDVDIYEIDAEGNSVFLVNDKIRARYRNSLQLEELVKTNEINPYIFDGFYFYAKTIKANSRLRLTIKALNSVFHEKNYQSGGIVVDETGEDAQTGQITLHQGGKYASYLELPINLK